MQRHGRGWGVTLLAGAALLAGATMSGGAARAGEPEVPAGAAGETGLPAASDFPAVRTQRLEIPGCGRVLRQDVIVDAPIGEVWDLWTTGPGLESWMTAHADVDLRVGGAMRSNYLKDGTLEDGNAITNRILAFETPHVLAIQAVAPENRPELAVVKDCWSVLRMEEVGPARTRVTCTGLGYGSGEDFDRIYAFFESGNAWTLDKLRRHFEDRASALGQERARVLALVGRLVGGEWIHEGQGPGGGIFRVRNVATKGPGGGTIVTRGWLGNDQGMFDHSSCQVYADAESGQVRFLNLDEQGNASRGAITSPAPDVLEWDWRVASATGHDTRFGVRMTFTGPDAYNLAIDTIDASGAAAPMIRADFRRVDAAPASFLKVMGTP